MNKHFESPKDKYVTLDDTYWTPYVELLVGYDIAVRTPDDSAKLRLKKYSAMNGF